MYNIIYVSEKTRRLTMMIAISKYIKSLQKKGKRDWQKTRGCKPGVAQWNINGGSCWHITEGILFGRFAMQCTHTYQIIIHYSQWCVYVTLWCVKDALWQSDTEDFSVLSVFLFSDSFRLSLISDPLVRRQRFFEYTSHSVISLYASGIVQWTAILVGKSLWP